MSNQDLTIAVEGCCHGELDKIFATVKYLQQIQKVKIDLLICCGDFQAVRNASDLLCMACPPKYRHMRTFHKYYSGELKAPVPTLFIGGNHEAINHLTELYYGGWVAPDIYFLGFSGVIKFGGIRIGGLSGVFTSSHYHWNHSELPPYQEYQLKTAYHVREFEVFKLKQLNPEKKMDIFLSHDWPAGITNHGNLQELLRYKRFLRSEIESGEFGNPPAMELLEYLKPDHWFAAHLHTKFVAVRHHQKQNGIKPNCTKFLALDKCLPNRDFLQMVTIPGAKGPKQFEYDEEWLSIVHATHNHLVWQPSGNFREPDDLDLETSRAFIKEVFQDMKVPKNFKQTVPLYNGEKGKMPRRLLENLQTTEFLERMGLQFHVGQSQQVQWDVELLDPAVNNEEIKLTSEDDVDVPKNEEEIDLDDEFEGQKNSEEVNIDMEDDDDVDDIIDVWEDEDDEYESGDSQLDDDQLDELIEDQIRSQAQRNDEKPEKDEEVGKVGDDKTVNEQSLAQEKMVDEQSGVAKVELQQSQ